MYYSSKNVFPKKVQSKNSFCREIFFHGKEILSYCTTSVNDLNEKVNEIISCLAIQDILSIYFPFSSIEQFIQICRKKQITRFKPDKSTDCDATLRLINIQELEKHWNFILKELLPNPPIEQNDQLEKKEILENDFLLKKNIDQNFSSNFNHSNSENLLQLSSKESSNENCSIQINNLNEKENLTRNDLNDQNSSFVQEKKEIHCNSLENTTQDHSAIIKEKDFLKKKIGKRNRRRKSFFSYSNQRQRRRKRRISNKNKSLSNEQFWMKKYSIETFAILIHRYQIPEE